MLKLLQIVLLRVIELLYNERRKTFFEDKNGKGVFIGVSAIGLRDIGKESTESLRTITSK